MYLKYFYGLSEWLCNREREREREGAEKKRKIKYTKSLSYMFSGYDFLDELRTPFIVCLLLGKNQ